MITGELNNGRSVQSLACDEGRVKWEEMLLVSSCYTNRNRVLVVVVR